jgi:crossover junction endodeoxyribonuclease RuvC
MGINLVGKAAEGKIILGIDPGTNVMGYGLITVAQQKVTLLQYGVVYLNKYNSQALKLQKIFERVLQIIDEYLPDELAIEAPFYGKNVQSMLKLGRAQGVAIAAALSREIPIVEYAPKAVKQSVTGNGNASKEQVAAMLERLLVFDNAADNLLDATDALAVALCHLLKGSTEKAVKKNDWSSFVKDNPDRVK